LTLVASRTEVNDLDDRAFKAVRVLVSNHSSYESYCLLLQENVLRLQIAMDQFRFVQQTQAIQQLLRKYSYKRSAQSSELILLDELIQVHREQLKDQAQMLFVDECILQS
jgi:hypothetical protein